MRKTLAAATAGLTLALLAGTSAARAGDPAPLTRPDVERIVHDYLLQNPEVIYQAVQELQRRHDAEEAKKQQVAVDQHKDQIFANIADPVGRQSEGRRHAGRVLRLSLRLLPRHGAPAARAAEPGPEGQVRLQGHPDPEPRS